MLWVYEFSIRMYVYHIQRSNTKIMINLTSCASVNSLLDSLATGIVFFKLALEHCCTKRDYVLAYLRKFISLSLHVYLHVLPYAYRPLLSLSIFLLSIVCVLCVHRRICWLWRTLFRKLLINLILDYLIPTYVPTHVTLCVYTKKLFISLLF